MLSNPALKALIVALFGFFALQSLTACETSEGFGRDLQNLGSGIEDEADDE